MTSDHVVRCLTEFALSDRRRHACIARLTICAMSDNQFLFGDVRRAATIGEQSIEGEGPHAALTKVTFYENAVVIDGTIASDEAHPVFEGVLQEVGAPAEFDGAQTAVLYSIGDEVPHRRRDFQLRTAAADVNARSVKVPVGNRWISAKLL